MKEEILLSKFGGYVAFWDYEKCIFSEKTELKNKTVFLNALSSWCIAESTNVGWEIYRELSLEHSKIAISDGSSSNLVSWYGLTNVPEQWTIILCVTNVTHSDARELKGLGPNKGASGLLFTHQGFLDMIRSKLFYT